MGVGGSDGAGWVRGMSGGCFALLFLAEGLEGLEECGRQRQAEATSGGGAAECLEGAEGAVSGSECVCEEKERASHFIS